MSAQDPNDHDSQAVRRSQRSTRRRPSRYLEDDQKNVDVLFPATEETESGSTSSLVESARSDAINAEAVSTRTECSMCSLCKAEMEAKEHSVECNLCKGKTHQACLHMSDEEFDTLNKGPDLSQWCCARCRLIKANNIKWGQHTGESDLRCIITSIYRT